MLLTPPLRPRKSSSTCECRHRSYCDVHMQRIEWALPSRWPHAAPSPRSRPLSNHDDIELGDDSRSETAHQQHVSDGVQNGLEDRVARCPQPGACVGRNEALCLPNDTTKLL